MSEPFTGASKKIIWLASYPKSGNTWLRAFITALIKGEVNINGLETEAIFSSRPVFDIYSGLDNSLLTNDEAKALQGAIFNDMSLKTKKERLFVKVHDAYTFLRGDEPLIPTENTRCAIYLIRNPLDIAASFASHRDDTIDSSIEIMNDDNGRFSIQNNQSNTQPQFEQCLLNWSEHVLSWTSKPPFPVLALRYEDMLADATNTFYNAAKFMGIEADLQQVEDAIIASRFEQLQKKEKETGFREKQKNNPFFRNGTAGNWQKELEQHQIAAIITKHKAVMEMYGYYVDA
jgi:Sulfotransferase domain